jgi:6-phosphogluconolactonase
VKTEVLPSAAAVAGRAAEVVLAVASAAIERSGSFSLVLAGGTTPAACYDRLATSRADWRRWHVYFGDERCLDPDDPQRNSAMAAAHLTDRVPIPATQVHAIPAERGPENAARAYAALIEPALPFDLVLLGMGEDGHTASLFPGHQHPPDALVSPVRGAPKPPAERVTLGVAALTGARQLLVLVTGAGKRAAMQRWRAGGELPVAQVASADNVLLLLDREAAP